MREDTPLRRGLPSNSYLPEPERWGVPHSAECGEGSAPRPRNQLAPDLLGGISGLHMEGRGLKNKKHPSRLVVGRHVCGFAQDPLRVSAFLSYRTVCQLVRCKDTTFPRTNKIFCGFSNVKDYNMTVKATKMAFLSPLSAF